MDSAASLAILRKTWFDTLFDKYQDWLSQDANAKVYVSETQAAGEMAVRFVDHTIESFIIIDAQHPMLPALNALDETDARSLFLSLGKRRKEQDGQDACTY